MTRPANLIFFLTDNHNRNFLGSAGHPMVKTPALDSIAERGVRFSSAYCATTLCCPSRAALATGRYPHQTSYWDNAMIYDGRVPTWHHRLRDAGVETTAIGKLHYRSHDDDNGFSEEINTMHVVDGKGSLLTLLRATEEGVPSRGGHKGIYADSTVGEADYQIYDRDITVRAVDWLKAHADSDQPWALLVSYPSPHPPFKVPQRFWDMYAPEDAPMPVQWRPDGRPKHPAMDYLAWMNQIEDGFDEEFIRKAIAGYCGLITHTDEQIGQVLGAAERLGLMEDTRVVYTSDHGEAVGDHGVLGKACLMEHSVGVPLLMAGPGVPEGRVIDQPVSQVDLYPTLVESCGASLTEEDHDLMGRSLWPAMNGGAGDRAVFAEYHAMGSKNSSFVLRDGDFKLIYHVEMPNQLFHLKADPREEVDLLAEGAAHPKEAELVAKLRQLVDPEALDARSKAEQRAHMEKFGGEDEVRKAGSIAMSPIPGKNVDLEAVGGSQ